MRMMITLRGQVLGISTTAWGYPAGSIQQLSAEQSLNASEILSRP